MAAKYGVVPRYFQILRAESIKPICRRPAVTPTEVQGASRSQGNETRTCEGRSRLALRARFGNDLIPYPLTQAFLPRDQAARILAEHPPGDIFGPDG